MRVAICDTDANIMKLVEEFVINSLKSRNEEVFIEKYDSSLALSDDISDKAVFDVCFIHAEMKGLNGVGVEKVFPLNSPNVEKIEVIRKGKVRRSKLYYLRDRVGKAAKVKEQL